MPAFKRAFVLFVCILFISSTLPTSASSYFSENFNDNVINSEIWDSNENSGEILVGNGLLSVLRSSVPSDTFPYIYSKSNIFPTAGGFSIRIKYNYLTTGRFGDGITISPGDVPTNGTNPDSDLYRFMIFMIYQDSTNGLSFGKFICDENGSNCTTRTFLRPFTHTTDLGDHEVRLDYTDSGQYLIYLDGSTSPEYVSGTNQRRPQKIWLGNSLKTNTLDNWSSFQIDSIQVSPINSTNPVVIIPGFGGSWDIGAILAGAQGNNWNVPSFVKNYDTVVSSLENTGLVMDTDLFMFSYDWRKTLDNLADDLNTFIESKNLTGKVDVIGHSMGGLVARAYAQKYGVNKIDKILTVGTPNMGVTDLYGLWEGAKIWDGSAWWQNVLLEIATEINRLPGETKVAAIRRVSPSILDLFPTYTFLSLNGVDKPLTAMNQQNLYLKNLNTDTTTLTNKLIPFWSEDISTTKRKIKVTTRTAADILEQRWEDGSPISINPFEITTGDGTVTKESAVGPFINGQKLAGWHGDLLSNQDNLGKIFQTLGLDTTKITSPVQTDNRKYSFVAILRSPGTLEVCDLLLINCNDELGLYFPEYKLFILPGYDGEGLKVRVKEAGFGSYKLHLGNIDESPDWVVKDGNLENISQIDSYEVRRNGENIFVYPQLVNKDQCKKDGWKIFDYLGFRNQGLCVSYLERFQK